tara:strand:- start:2819 stop:3136 length:318 start_codon:yes stop_codon:yes gene_type:complete
LSSIWIDAEYSCNLSRIARLKDGRKAFAYEIELHILTKHLDDYEVRILNPRQKASEDVYAACQRDRIMAAYHEAGRARMVGWTFAILGTAIIVLVLVSGFVEIIQ